MININYQSRIAYQLIATKKCARCQCHVMKNDIFAIHRSRDSKCYFCSSIASSKCRFSSEQKNNKMSTGKQIKLENLHKNNFTLVSH